MKEHQSIVLRNETMRAFEQMSLNEIRALPMEHVIFVQPVGGLEPHGENYPIGCDVLEAMETARFIGELPKEPESSESLKKMIVISAHPIEFSPQLHLKKIAPQLSSVAFKQLIMNRAQLLANLGFRKCVWVTGTRTPRHLGILYEALSVASRKSNTAHLLLGYQEKPSLTQNTSSLYPSTQSHGHSYEESLVRRLGFAIPTPMSAFEITEHFLESSLKKWWFNEVPLSWNRLIEKNFDPKEHEILLHKERKHLKSLLTDFLKEPKLLSHHIPPGAMYPWNRSYFKSYVLGTITAILWAFLVSWALNDLMPQ